MTTFAGMARRYRSAIADGILYENAIMDSDVELVDVNKDSLLQGLNALGVKITPPYKNSTYALKKQAKNALPGYGTPDLYNTGDFYERIEFHISGKLLVWEDSDKKAANLLAKYKSVLGVSEGGSLNKWRNLFLIPAIVKEIKAKTGMR